jgi:hypothetical protein
MTTHHHMSSFQPQHSTLVLNNVLRQFPEYKSVFSSAAEYRRMFPSKQGSPRRPRPAMAMTSVAETRLRRVPKEEEDEPYDLFGDILELDCLIVEHMRQ